MENKDEVLELDLGRRTLTVTMHKYRTRAQRILIAIAKPFLAGVFAKNEGMTADAPGDDSVSSDIDCDCEITVQVGNYQDSQKWVGERRVSTAHSRMSKSLFSNLHPLPTLQEGEIYSHINEESMIDTREFSDDGRKKLSLGECGWKTWIMSTIQRRNGSEVWDSGVGMGLRRWESVDWSSLEE